MKRRTAGPSGVRVRSARLQLQIRLEILVGGFDMHDPPDELSLVGLPANERYRDCPGGIPFAHSASLDPGTSLSRHRKVSQNAVGQSLAVDQCVSRHQSSVAVRSLRLL